MALKIVMATAEDHATTPQRGLNPRDIKPENVILTKDGTSSMPTWHGAAAADEEMGVSRGRECDRAPIHQPRQPRLGDVEIRSDISSWAPRLYHRITGASPKT